MRRRWVRRDGGRVPIAGEGEEVGEPRCERGVGRRTRQQAPEVRGSKCLQRKANALYLQCKQGYFYILSIF